MLLIYFFIIFGSAFGVETGSWKHLSEDADEELLNWSAPTNFSTQFPYYLSGCDYEDRPVIVIPTGEWDTAGVVVEGGENLYNLERRQDQLLERLRVGFFRNICLAEGTKEFVVIFDYDEIGYSTVSSSEYTNFLMRAYRKWDKCYQNIAYGFIINVNFMTDQVISLIRVVTPHFIDRMEVYGTDRRKFVPQFLRKIPTSAIPLPYRQNNCSGSVLFY